MNAEDLKMKLLLCNKCGDMFNLSLDLKTCSCGETKGMYTDNLNAWYEGECTPFCIHNQEFKEACVEQKIQNRLAPKDLIGRRFSAWICPAGSPTFVKKDCHKLKEK